MDDGGLIFAQEEQSRPHSEGAEELADDDADELCLLEVLGAWLVVREVEAVVEAVVEVVVEVVVGSSSSSYVGVPSSSIVIVTSGSFHPGGNSMDPGG